MRNIKFRAWCQYNETMLRDVDIHNGMAKWGTTWFERAPLMQFTGLTDKNGKEIYEGDVVEVFKELSESCDAEETIWCKYIKWNEETSAWAVMVKPMTDYGISVCGYIEDWDDDHGYNLTSYHAQDLEVIGNIWENPELVNLPSEKAA